MPPSQLTLAVVRVLAVGFLLLAPAIPQDQVYHAFADHRSLRHPEFLECGFEPALRRDRLFHRAMLQRAPTCPRV